ncbi:ankyrin repeat-containing domain protein [Coprinopsis sp. MPI-PUGE-AT-0042]|nr:ankyrin repeat-containing domain protein [Coprinopsis sp. MPI-PUGE-AT-0042]
MSQPLLQRTADLQDLLGSSEIFVRDELVASGKSMRRGMFSHTPLQLGAVCQFQSAQDVEETLPVSPSQVEDAYIQTWNRILNQHPQHVSLAKAILLWVLNSQRPMTIEELQCAVAMSSDTFTFDSSRVVPDAMLLSTCSGLVTFEEESRLVRLVHYTARAPLENLLLDSFPHPHSILAALCMTRLADCGFQNTTLDSEEELRLALDDDPILVYAHEAWAFHSHLSLDVKVTARQLAEFVTNCHAFPVLIYDTFDLLNPLHLVAFYKLPITLAGSYNHSHLNTRTMKCGYAPIALACLRGNQAVLEAVLSLPGVSVNSQDMDGWSALMHAAYEGEGSIVELLLAHPDISAPSLLHNDGHSLLTIAADRGHSHIFELLVAHREAQPNFIDAGGLTALMRAASTGHEQIVKLLLADPRTEVNLVDEDGWSALVFAAFAGHEGIVKLFLAHHAANANIHRQLGEHHLR